MDQLPDGLPDGALPVQEATVVQPGDHLVVRCSEGTTREQAENLADLIQGQLPILAGVLVLAGVEALYVVRDEGNDG